MLFNLHSKTENHHWTLGLATTIVTTMFNVQCSTFSQTPKVDHFNFTLISTDLLELLPVQATGNENV